jgi:sugar lactone lactonase YvrE
LPRMVYVNRRRRACGTMRSEEPIIDGMACVVKQAQWVIRDIPVGMGPEGVAVDPAGRRAFVACSRSNAVTAVRLDEELGRNPI